MGSEREPRGARRAEVPDAGHAQQAGGDEGVAAVDEPAPPPDRDRVFDQHAPGVVVVAVVRDAGAEQARRRQRREVDAQRPPRQQQVEIADEEAIEVRRVAEDRAPEHVQPQRVPARHRPVERRLADGLDELVAGTEQAARRLQRQRDAHAGPGKDRIGARIEIDAGRDAAEPAGPVLDHEVDRRRAAGRQLGGQRLLAEVEARVQRATGNPCRRPARRPRA